jgi:hypothetical protein
MEASFFRAKAQAKATTESNKKEKGTFIMCPHLLLHVRPAF